jgi:tryptophan synthase alpha chain
MNPRIQACFAGLTKQSRQALVPYITAGYPEKATTVPLMHAMVAAGADIIELGVPFSDPMADGPVIQAAGDVALAQGVNIKEVLRSVREFRLADAQTPIVLMGYTNPVERYGLDRFMADAKDAGVDGLVVVDTPPEESLELAQKCRDKAMDLIFFLAPTSTDERIKMVADVASGYVYYVSMRGITGAGHMDMGDVIRKVTHLKKSLPMPVGVGFGIRDADSAKTIASVADAVIIGTKIIQLLGEGPGDQAITRVAQFLSGVRMAMDTSRASI